MRRKSLFAVATAALGLGLVSTAGTARAQDVNDAAVIRALYEKLFKVFNIDTAKAGQVNSNVLVLMNPGYALDWTAEDMDKDLVIQEDVAAALNRLPQPSFTFMDGPYNLEQVWSNILKFKDTPKIDLTDDEKKRLNDAQAYLDANAGNDPDGTPETRLDRYYRLQIAWQEAQDAYEGDALMAVKEGRAPKQTLRTKATQAKNAFETTGKKNEVEGNLETVLSIGGKDPQGYWNNLRTDFETTFRRTGTNGQVFHVTTTIPRIRAWKQEAGWTRIVVDTTNKDDMVKTSSLDSKFGGGGFAGLFTIGGSGGFSQDSKRTESNSKNLKIDMEVKRVFILRPWMDPLIFRSTFWRIIDPLAQPFFRISSGQGITDGRPRQNEVMPLLPTGVLLARNVKLTGKFSKEMTDELNRAWNSKLSVGYGPFAIGGSVNSKNGTKYTNAKMDDSGISFTEPQIIGVYVDVLPRVPDPNVKLFGDK